MTSPEGRPDNDVALTGRVTQGDGGITAEDITGLVKVVTDSSIRLTAWAAMNSLRATRRVVAAIREPEQAPELIEDFRSAAAALTHAVVGDGDGDTWIRRAGESSPIVHAVLGAVDSIAPVVPNPGGATMSAAVGAVSPVEDRDAVRAHARRLLQRSRDVHDRDTAHPAYLTIVRQLAPDELRILLLVLRHGPQPVVDIRPGGLGASTASPVARGLNMVGAMAGARYVSRVPSYLHNLERLGLLENSRELLRDPVQYSVLEAQPDVLGHLHANRRAKIVRRSLRLTPFGDDFLNVGLGLGERPTDDLAGLVAADAGVADESAAPGAGAAAEPMSHIVDVHIPPPSPARRSWPTAAAAEADDSARDASVHGMIIPTATDDPVDPVDAFAPDAIDDLADLADLDAPPHAPAAIRLEDDDRDHVQPRA